MSRNRFCDFLADPDSQNFSRFYTNIRRSRYQFKISSPAALPPHTHTSSVHVINQDRLGTNIAGKTIERDGVLHSSHPEECAALRPHAGQRPSCSVLLHPRHCYPLRAPIRKRGSFLGCFPLCLSRAWLGKMMAFFTTKCHREGGDAFS